MGLFKSLNIRGQLLLAMFVSAMLVALVGLAVETAKHTRTIRTWSTQEAESVADAMGQDFLKLVVLGEPDGAANLVTRLASFMLIQHVVVYDTTDKPLFSYDRNMIEAHSAADANIAHQFTVSRPITDNGSVYGKVDLTVSSDRFQAGVSDYYQYLATLIPALLAISILSALYFQRFFTAPVLSLTTFMRRVTQERDFDQRVTDKRSDEFGELFSGLNALLTEMQAAQHNILQQNKELSAAILQVQEHERQLVAEHRATEEALRAKLDAESANREKSAFLASMSHELRTPLNAIIGYSEMLDEEATADGNHTASGDLRKIRAAGQHLLSLINDVLDLSKIEAGKMQIELHTFEVRDLIDDTLLMIEPLLKRNNNRLVRDITVTGLQIHSDPVRIRQVLFNLLSNACKFTQDGTITISVALGTGTDNNRIFFSLRDTGTGMAPADLEKLFQPFVQADSVGRKHEGTGLGLALCRRFCEMMGGQIAATSTRGQGSEFSFWLPIDIRPQQDVRSVAASHS